MSKKEIAATLKRLRIAKGLTAKEVGSLVGKSDKTVGAWENGRGQPDADTLFLLCDIYDVLDIQREFGYKEVFDFPVFSLDENTLIQKYRRLNDSGKLKLEEQLEDMLLIPKYTEESKDFKIG